MSYGYKNPTPEQIKRRQEHWRAYYWRDPEKHRDRARRYKAGLTGEKLEAYRERMRAYLKEWRERNPDYHQRPERRAYAREWKRRERELNPEKVKRAEKGRLLKRKYGITLEQYEQMFAQQGGVCAICKRPETSVIKGSLIQLSVDHHHTEGRVRGLLCFRCNALIGTMADDPALIRAAADYLDRS